MAKKISASVGKGGKNKPADAKTVQELLNPFASKAGFTKLKIDSDCGPKTIGAIGKFQKSVVAMTRPDSRVDPNGDSFKALVAGPKAASQTTGGTSRNGSSSGSGGPPQVSGPTNGVDKKIIGVLEAVSSHYGKPIVVTSGLRSPKKQGEVMWDYWVKNLKRGDLYTKIKNDKQLKEELNKYYDEGNKKAFVEKIAKDARSYSRHVWGHAVDIKKNTDAKMVAAISTVLRKVTEDLCYHFDDRNCTVPATISESIKRKWR